MVVWHPYYIICSKCNHRNRPDRATREGIRKALLGQAGNCKGCGKKLKPELKMTRPMMKQVAEALREEGHKLAKPGKDIDWRRS